MRVTSSNGFMPVLDSRLKNILVKIKPLARQVTRIYIAAAHGNGAHAGAESATGEWVKHGQFFDYAKSADVQMSPIPIQSFPGDLHEGTESSAIIPLDLSKEYGVSYPATSPNMLSSFVRITPGDSLETRARATSEAFYVIRGSGRSHTPWGTVEWSKGDAFILPGSMESISHEVEEASSGTADGSSSLYWVTDEPLLKYLGVAACEKRFEPAFFCHEDMVRTVKELKEDPASAKKNRIGALLANKAFADSTQTLSHVLWALFDVLPANGVQPPHKHSATALDMAVYAPPGTYTLMAREIDAEGQLIDPVKVPWDTGGMFVTPPGWWHSHHNESEEDAWVLPVQDAALYTHQRTLDIRFAKQEAQEIKLMHERGATFSGQSVLVNDA